jgi:hypothetical protein
MLQVEATEEEKEEEEEEEEEASVNRNFPRIYFVFQL